MKAIQAALYARVSSGQQANAQTIVSQLSALRERMQTDGCLSLAELEFVDEGWSGATLMRPALERLRDTTAFGGIDRLYVHSPDRLARKYAYQVLLIDELQRAGVEIVFLNHAMGQTPEDDLLIQVQGMVAEYERAKILERSRRGKRHKARNGQVSVLSGAPYGYRYVTVAEGAGCARYDIIAEQAQVVQSIFEWVGRGRVTIGEVCRRLACSQIPSPHGKKVWDRTTVWYMLKNPAYQGRAVFGRKRKCAAQSNLRPRRGQSMPAAQSGITTTPDQWLPIAVPALVDADLFAAVQEQLQENRDHARAGRQGASYLLQGLVVCKQCGYAYCGRHCSKASASGQRSHYRYYRCTGSDASRFGGQRVCANTQVRTDCLDQAVWQEVCTLLNDPRRLAREYDRRLQALAQPADDVRRRSMDKQLHQCRQGIVRLIDAYTEGYLEKGEFDSRIVRLKERQQVLENQIEQVDNEALSHAELQLIIGRLEDFAATVKVGLEAGDFARQRDLICTLVKRIEIDREQVNVVFRIEPIPTGNGSQDCRSRVYGS